jgi:Holliday junction resolvase
MARTPEKAVKDKVVAVLKQRGVYYFFPATFGMGRSGVPDIICCSNGRFLAIECKAGKNTPTPLQIREMAAISEAGGIAIVVNEGNLDAVSYQLDHMNRRNNHE